MGKLLALWIIFVSYGALAGEADGRCNLPASLCALQEKFEKASGELSTLCGTILYRINADAFSEYYVDKRVLQQSFELSQSAWVEFRESNCSAFYALHSGGRQRNEARLECEIEMTNGRIRYLKQVYL